MFCSIARHGLLSRPPPLLLRASSEAWPCPRRVELRVAIVLIGTVVNVLVGTIVNVIYAWLRIMHHVYGTIVGRSTANEVGRVHGVIVRHLTAVHVHQELMGRMMLVGR